MSASDGGRVLAIVPARGGSKGLPGKNLASLAGLPLLAHSLLLAALCPEIDRTIVSTDSEAIAEVARAHGGETPFLRPPELSGDEAAMWPVVRHALAHADDDFEYVVLLDPTSPGRLPEDVHGALERVVADRRADGIVAVSDPGHNPIWHAVVERDGYLAQLIEGGGGYARRQDVPPVYRINASLYIWRARFVREEHATWQEGRHLLWQIPERRAVHVDSAEDLELLELYIREGLLLLPWLDASRPGA
jgi:CMP-N,N'-diacetyllegionaminic acid synthase